jgi:hypothetical protein
MLEIERRIDLVQAEMNQGKSLEDQLDSQPTASLQRRNWTAQFHIFNYQLEVNDFGPVDLDPLGAGSDDEEE